jgi:hypothetical protein
VREPSVGEDCADTTTTWRRDTDPVAAFLGGFTAAEGCFTGDGRGFLFAVGLGATDTETADAFAAWFGVGHVHHRRRREPHYDDEVTFSVHRTGDLVNVIVPFMDEHLPPSSKREQYLAWRARVMEYWETGMRRRRLCTIEGCDAVQRAKGLCRRHYYLAFGQ